MFFIESSGRDHLLIRQTCAIESAIRNSKIDQFYVVMTSPNLNVTANNATCQLFTRYSNVIFRHVDLDVLFEETPLQELHSGKVDIPEVKLFKESYRNGQNTASLQF